MNFQFMWWSVVPRLFILTLALPNQGMAIGVINIMKKVFVKPKMEVLEIGRVSICAQSNPLPGAGGENSTPSDE